VRAGRARIPFVVVAVGLAAVIVVFPPWRARAIRTTARYDATPGIAPATLIDTVRWTLAFAPLYAPPRATLGGGQMRELASRSLSGDTTAKAELRRSTAAFEARFHVPEILRASGALWRDSVLAKAGIPSLTSYDLSFAVDQRWMAARLTVWAAIAFVASWRLAGSRGNRSPRD
jgi:hypothetical protein